MYIKILHYIKTKIYHILMQINLGDEIDFIQKRSPDNSNYLIINRCILLSIKTEQKEDFKIKLLQNKSLLIEEYKDKWHNDTTN